MISTDKLNERVVSLGKRRGAICMSEKERFEMALKDIQEMTGFSVEALTGRGRPDDLSMARFCLYICLVRLGFTYSSAGRWCKRDHVAVRHGVLRLESVRDLAGVNDAWGIQAQQRLKYLRDKGYRV